ncbi:MAG: type II secretion system protein M [Proteobacteria bacterium]|nr:type II secretion system protein M [Pseudomonadota bacterium]
MFHFFRNMISGLSERERRLVTAAGLVFAVLIIILLWFLVTSKVGELREENKQYGELLRLIDAKKQVYMDKVQKSKAIQQTNKPIPLRTLVDKISRELGVTVPDVKELPDQRPGGNWLERSVEISMREIGLVDLTRFMETVEGNRRRFPIAISRLEVRNRKRTPDTYNVKMTIATYERGEEVGTDKRLKGKGRKGGR